MATTVHEEHDKTPELWFENENIIEQMRDYCRLRERSLDIFTIDSEEFNDRYKSVNKQGTKLMTTKDYLKYFRDNSLFLSFLKPAPKKSKKNESYLTVNDFVNWYISRDSTPRPDPIIPTDVSNESDAVFVRYTQNDSKKIKIRRRKKGESENRVGHTT